MKKQTEQKEIIIDAGGKVLGRLATKVALMLRGKDTVSFQPHILDNRYVFVYNLSQVRLTGKKPEGKIYWHHSGYPGGIRSIRYKDLFQKDPTIPFRKAVWGMLPKNKLRSRMMGQLMLYSGERKDSPLRKNRNTKSAKRKILS